MSYKMHATHVACPLYAKSSDTRICQTTYTYKYTIRQMYAIAYMDFGSNYIYFYDRLETDQKNCACGDNQRRIYVAYYTTKSYPNGIASTPTRP